MSNRQSCAVYLLVSIAWQFSAIECIATDLDGCPLSKTPTLHHGDGTVSLLQTSVATNLHSKRHPLRAANQQRRDQGETAGMGGVAGLNQIFADESQALQQRIDDVDVAMKHMNEHDSMEELQHAAENIDHDDLMLSGHRDAKAKTALLPHNLQDDNDHMRLVQEQLQALKAEESSSNELKEGELLLGKMRGADPSGADPSGVDANLPEAALVQSSGKAASESNGFFQDLFEWSYTDAHSLPQRNKVILATLELVFPLGWFGIDRLYLGQPILALLKILGFLTFCFMTGLSTVALLKARGTSSHFGKCAAFFIWTCGVVGILWAFIDAFVVAQNCLLGSKYIQQFGMGAWFGGELQITVATVLGFCIVLVWLGGHTLIFYHLYWRLDWEWLEWAVQAPPRPLDLNKNPIYDPYHSEAWDQGAWKNTGEHRLTEEQITARRTMVGLPPPVDTTPGLFIPPGHQVPSLRASQ